MNHTEKRRQKLLEQTRNLYTDRRSVPAVHPRYQAAYHQIYSEDMPVLKSTFGIRVLISTLLFMAFSLMKTQGTQILGFDNLQVIETIMHSFI